MRFSEHQRIRLLAVAIPLLLLTLPLRGQQSVYMKVSIADPAPDTSDTSLATVLQRLPSFDPHTLSRSDRQQMTTVLTREDVNSLRSQGYNVRVLVEDLQQWYVDRAQERNEKEPKVQGTDGAQTAPQNFRLGGVAGYYTLAELEEELTRMRTLYPDLVSDIRTIGKSVEGRDIRGIRITRAADTLNTPAVLFTGLHHAREPIGMMAIVYAMWHLLESSGESPEIDSLLNNRLLWFVPMVNPDGYQYNLTTFPEGGGLWRKNRGGVDGIDLNRNYGPQENWSTPPDGASDLPTSGFYRGEAPFSEPETRAIRDFVRDNGIRILLNNHSFGRLLIHLNEEGADETAQHYLAARSLIRENGYAQGSPLVAVGSEVSGSCERWMVEGNGANDTHALAWAPEIGSEEDGFWPAPERIAPLCREILPAHIAAAWMAGPSSFVTDQHLVEADGKSLLELRITNSGVEATPSEMQILLSDFSDINAPLPPLAPGTSATVRLPLPFELTFAGEARRKVAVQLHAAGLLRIDTVTMIFHSVDTLLADTYEESLSQWDPDLWYTQNDDERGRVLADSPYEPYALSGIPNIIELADPVSLVGYDAVDLRFAARAEIAGIGHRLRIEIGRADEGVWHPVDGEFLQKPRESSSDERTEMRGEHASWQQYTISLDEYAGDEILLRMVMETPPPGPRLEGVLIDDLVILGAVDGFSSVRIGPDSATLPFSAPTIFRDVLQVGGEGDIDLVLYDPLGRKAATGSGRQTVRLSTSSLPPGPYLLQIRTEGGIFTKKVLRR